MLMCLCGVDFDTEPYPHPSRRVNLSAPEACIARGFSKVDMRAAAVPAWCRYRALQVQTIS
jgi:hypothetical protein